MLRVIVCGGKHYSDRKQLFAVLDRVRALRGDFTVVHATTPGAEVLAGEWARDRGVPEEPHAPRWHTLGDRAGAINMQNMLMSGVDGVIAFRGGWQSGDLVLRAELADVPVMRIR